MGRLRPIGRFNSAAEHEALVEGVLRARRLKMQIELYAQYRAMGIRTLEQVLFLPQSRHQQLLNVNAGIALLQSRRGCTRSTSATDRRTRNSENTERAPRIFSVRSPRPTSPEVWTISLALWGRDLVAGSSSLHSMSLLAWCAR